MSSVWRWRLWEQRLKLLSCTVRLRVKKERADSDVDLMVLGDAPFSDVVSALSPAQRALGREINPTVFPVSEFRSKLVAGNHFLRSVMKGKRLFVLGTENELAKLASK